MVKAMIKITLLSSDQISYQVDEIVARRSGVIATVLEDIGCEHPIPLLNVHSYVLEKVLEYCEHHRNDPLPKDNDVAYYGISKMADARRRAMVIGDWDREFLDCEQELLFDIIQAASYLDIKTLLDLGCKTVANMMTGKSVEDIRSLFNIENDFTEEEELAMQVERSEIEMLYTMMGMSMDEPLHSQSLPPGPRRRRIGQGHPGRALHSNHITTHDV